MTRSFARTCPDCGTRNRVVVFATGLVPAWRICCSACGTVLTKPRAPRPAPSAEIVHLPVPVRARERAPARRADGRSMKARRDLLARCVPALRVPTGASTGMSFLAACGFVLALMVHAPAPAPGSLPAAGEAPYGLDEGAGRAAAPGSSTEPRLDRAALPAAAHLAQYRLAAAEAMRGRPEAYPDPLEGMMALQIAALTDPEAAAAAEESLGLSPAQRREVQRRLLMAAHDPRGVDGIFGPATRAALAAWQDDAGLPATGFATERALRLLARQTASEYAEWQAGERARRDRDRQIASASPSPQARPDRVGNCVRLASGRIAYGESVRCDLRGLRERFGSLREGVASLLEAERRSPWDRVRPGPGDA
jgi:peptidoglycan hydrolase-like protein with peptidoglycan-binding domain/ribosomal protein S27E